MNLLNTGAVTDGVCISKLTEFHTGTVLAEHGIHVELKDTWERDADRGMQDRILYYDFVGDTQGLDSITDILSGIFKQDVAFVKDSKGYDFAVSIGTLYTDDTYEEILDELEKHNINVEFMKRDESPSLEMLYFNFTDRLEPTKLKKIQEILEMSMKKPVIVRKHDVYDFVAEVAKDEKELVKFVDVFEPLLLDHIETNFNKWKLPIVLGLDTHNEPVHLDLAKAPHLLIAGATGCVDCDTEYFNGYGWKKISEYTQGENVLQYEKNGTARLVKPTRYIKNKSEKLWNFTSKGSDQCLSDDHNFVYLTSKGNVYSKPFIEVRKTHEKIGFAGKIITAFDYSGKGIQLSDKEIRLMCAVICDGNFPNNTNICRMNLKKEVKKNRIKKLLNELNIDYYTKQYNPRDKDFESFFFQAPLKAKHFEAFWYDCNKKQLKVIADEIYRWDGSITTNGAIRFRQNNKQTIDFVQFVYASLGKRTSIKCDDRIGEKMYNGYTRKNKTYTLNVCSRSKYVNINGANSKVSITEQKTKDGYQYCFTVPSSMLVLRKNDKIFITGNSGKSVTLNAIIANLVMSYENGNHPVEFIMIDPKQVELEAYNAIANMVCPVITDVDAAIRALADTCDEMEWRYSELAKRKLKNNDSEVFRWRVIIIDEMADLMMRSGKEVGEYVSRIAQLGRAAGVHLIVATQRPTVRVLTDLVKANLPTRIAFTVANERESKMIIDDKGAEQLQGEGDALLVTPASMKPTRFQACYISDDEVIEVCSMHSGTHPDYKKPSASAEWCANFVTDFEAAGSFTKYFINKLTKKFFGGVIW